MTTSQAHARSNRRQHAPGRPARPALLQRHSHHAKTHRPNSSKGKTEAGSEGDSYENREDDPMASSFLQYCAVCDKQIVVPGSSVLYCSESCRRSDTSNSPSYTIFKSDSIPPASATSATVPSPHPRDIVPQLSPTMTHHQHTSSTQAHADATHRDLPATSSHRRNQRSSTSRGETEASRYLGEFLYGERPPSRARDNRSSGTTTPLLSTTPTSSASASVPFTPTSATQSALPSRNPRWSIASSSSRSVDLVTPITYLSTAPSSLTTITDKTGGASTDDQSPTSTLQPSPHIGSELSYEKRKDISGSAMSPGRSSLKQLFRFDEMRSMPHPQEDYFGQAA